MFYVMFYHHQFVEKKYRNFILYTKTTLDSFLIFLSSVSVQVLNVGTASIMSLVNVRFSRNREVV